MVMSACHGKKYCHMMGDSVMRGSDICSDLQVVLKIVWTCTESKVIDEKYLDDKKTSIENLDANIHPSRTGYKKLENLQTVMHPRQVKTKDMDLEGNEFSRQEMRKIGTKFEKAAK